VELIEDDNCILIYADTDTFVNADPRELRRRWDELQTDVALSGDCERRVVWLVSPSGLSWF
jgi:hypothetical protein